MSQDLYQEIIIEEYRNPHNYGELPQADVILEEINSSCGDKLKVFLRFDDARPISSASQILDISWQGQGCAISMASLSLLSQHIKLHHLTLGQVAQLGQSDIEALLGLEEVATGRIKCLLLGLTAIKRALPSTE